MRRRAREHFTSIRTEGGLLPPELLARLAANDRELPGLEPESYHLGKGEKLAEAITRSWNRLRGAWETFDDARGKLAEKAPDAGLTRDRWLLVLFQELGYGRLPAARGLEAEGERFPISHAWHRSPIHLVGFRTDLDRRTPGVAGAARRSPHSLVQGFLNHSDEHLWGFVSNGLLLRLLRDSASLTRQAFVEFDLEAMLSGELYGDFALLWLLAHQSRVEADVPEQCWLERWAQAAQAQGARARETLRVGVEAAIVALGEGFLAHPRNGALREALRSGELGTQDYYRELLRLVYRLLFLFVAEDRGLLLDPNAKPDAKQRYLEHYSTARLRQRAARRRGSKHADLWCALRLVMQKLGDDAGSPDLALPPLGSFLWSADAVPHLAEADLANDRLLSALRALAFTEQNRVLRPVDWQNLDSEELGSVYESLLELHPEVDAGAAHFALDTAAGHERKTTGSYYTPDSLVQCLLDTALDPVLDEACAKGDPEQALLDLKVCDPACGSGHFLIAAARRIARRLAQVRTGDDEPDPASLQAALREVIGHCLYGVDVNPMAVELCKVSLWLEALEPGKPLSFLDHHIQCGNSLLGTTPVLLARGIPDDAWKPIEGDDKKVAQALRRQNREERRGQTTLFVDLMRDATPRYGSFAEAVAVLDALPGDSLADVHAKEERWRRLAASDEARRERLRADAWCAAFVWPKQAGAPEAPTFDLFLRVSNDPSALPRETRDEIERLAGHYHFFHWHLAFPDVFPPPEQDEAHEITGWTGGFDVVLSNPPWDRVRAQDTEFFAHRAPAIASAANAAARRRAISQLANDDSALLEEWISTVRNSEAICHFVRASGGLPLSARGDVNSYPLFVELSTHLLADHGRAGMVVPQGVVTDDSYAGPYRELCRLGHLRQVIGFVNERGFFPGVMHNVKFCLFTFAGRGAHKSVPTYCFNCENVAEAMEERRRYELDWEDIELMNPDTQTCPIFSWEESARLIRRTYKKKPVVSRSDWGLSYGRTLHMGEASESFVIRGGGFVPVYESKMVGQYNHRFASFGHLMPGQRSHILPQCLPNELLDPHFLSEPCYEIPERDLKALTDDGWSRSWHLAYRRITSLEVERTAVFSVLPRVGVSDSMMLIRFGSEPAIRAAVFLALGNSFAFDFVVRSKLGGRNLSQYIFDQIAVPSWNEISHHTHFDSSWIVPRVLELMYTAWDLEGFAKECGHVGPPFRWDDERRFWLRVELDAAFLCLYDASREEAVHLLDTFWIARDNDERAYGTYRTKHSILEVFDDLHEAISAGRPYRGRLEPPPADLRLGHRGPATAVVREQRRLVRVPGDREKRYVDRVPLLSVKAAAGRFAGAQAPEFQDWVQVEKEPPLRKGMFITQVKGRSMEPLIPADSYCLFQYEQPRDYTGSVVLVQIRQHGDPDEGGQYVVKWLRRGERETIRLESENPEVAPTELNTEDAECRVIARFIRVVGSEIE